VTNPAAIGSLSVSGSLVLVRHARPDMTDHRPETWGLADGGLDDARHLGLALRTAISNRASTVVCSTEPKAVETAVALGFGAVRPDERLCEVDRPWHDDRHEFVDAAHRYLRGTTVPGWEPLDDAAARFQSAVTELDDMAVVVSHGTVMSAWLSRQFPDLDAVGFWENLEMPDAWLVDLRARSTHRIAVHGGPDLPD
jgi:broad specificity phosphatase PhoE